jgi:peptidyl-prolyl cis-trans isomerase SurA
MNRYIIFCLFFFISKAIFSQESSSQENERVKIDGVAAVIGDFIVLDSDIDKQFAQLRVSGVSTKDITRCQIFGKLLEDKLYQHHAIQDSIIVNNSEIQSYVDQQIDMFAQQIGSMDKLIEYYNKSSEQELRSEMFELNKNSELAKKMQESIIEDIEITPEEVRQFFNLIPKQDRPIFGTELRVSQIVIIPKTTDEEKQKVVDRLKQFKVDVVESGASFVTKVVLYSDDIASRKNGGKYTINRKRSPMVKEFNEVAFSLEEGEISEPFESEFGYHIIFLEKIRGQEYDVRHILLRPNINSEDIKEAKDKIEIIRERIVSGN